MATPKAPVLPLPDDPDLGYDQPQEKDTDESTSELAKRYGSSENHAST